MLGGQSENFCITCAVSFLESVFRYYVRPVRWRRTHETSCRHHFPGSDGVFVYVCAAARRIRITSFHHFGKDRRHGETPWLFSVVLGREGGKNLAGDR